MYIYEVCKSIFAWNSAQYVEAEQNKYYERKKDATTFPDKPVSWIASLFNPSKRS